MKKIKVLCIAALVLAAGKTHAGFFVIPVKADSSISSSCTALGEVESAGQCWMNRNLGALRGALSPTDAYGYGGYFQWGRLNDGHAYPDSINTTDLSPGDVPGHGNFISGSDDWRASPNGDLWQGVDGTNNPCPAGFRLPTKVELQTEEYSWVSDDVSGAFASPLKLTASGYRVGSDGQFSWVDSMGDYWSSTIYDDTSSWALHIGPADVNTFMVARYRAYGLNVRCIKD